MIWNGRDSMDTIINGELWQIRDDGSANGMGGNVTSIDTDYDKSVTGKAFHGGTGQLDYFNTPAGVKEIWFKFDMFLTNSLVKGNRFFFGHYSAALDGYVGIWNDVNNPKKILLDAEPVAARDTGFLGVTNSINHISLHMLSDSTNGLIELTVNGETYTFTGNVNNGADFDRLAIRSDNPNVLYSNLIVSNHAIDSDEGYHRDTCDVETFIYNGLRGWRYFNSGTADLLATGGTTVNVGFNKSVTGQGFYGGSRSDMFYTPSGLKEVWLRFDFYVATNLENNRTAFAAGFYSASVGNIVGIYNITNMATTNANNIYVLGTQAFTLNPPCFKRCLLHMISDSTNGLIELTLNGETYTKSGNINGGNDFAELFLYSAGSNVIFSNVIIAERETELAEGHHRELFSVESQITAPVLNVRWQGSNHQFTLSTKKSKPAFAVHCGDKNFYTPVVNADDALASALRLYLDDSNKSVVQS
jgi:hypothetical protein